MTMKKPPIEAALVFLELGYTLTALPAKDESNRLLATASAFNSREMFTTQLDFWRYF